MVSPVTLYSYISRCDNVISEKNLQQAHELVKEIVGVFQSDFEGITTGLESYHYSFGNTQSDYFKDISLLRARLQKELDALEENRTIVSDDNQSHHGIVVNNSINNSICFDVSFNSAKDLINNMNALPQSEIDEAIERINKLEEIIKSDLRKNQKWDKAKDILIWLAGKGVDVGIAILPLLLQIGK